MRVNARLLGLGFAALIGTGAYGIFQQSNRLQAQQKPSPLVPPKVDAPKPKTTPDPLSNNSTDPVFVGAGDIATCTNENDTATAKLINSIPGTVFTTGDNAYPRGTTEEFQKCYEPTWGAFKSRTYPTPGNHDYYSPEAAPYYAYFGDRAGSANQGYYSYTLGKWHIVALNSNIDAQAGSPQQQWLKADLAANRAACTLAYWHHPVFSSGVHGNDPKMKDIWQTLYDAGVDVVVNGHEHNYERFAPQTPSGKADPKRGIRQFVVGTGGAELRAIAEKQPQSEVWNSDTFGVIKFTLRDKSYDWEFLPIEGQSFTDKGSASCVGA